MWAELLPQVVFLQIYLSGVHSDSTLRHSQKAQSALQSQDHAPTHAHTLMAASTHQHAGREPNLQFFRSEVNLSTSACPLIFYRVGGTVNVKNVLANEMVHNLRKLKCFSVGVLATHKVNSKKFIHYTFKHNLFHIYKWKI